MYIIIIFMIMMMLKMLMVMMFLSLSVSVSLSLCVYALEAFKDRVLITCARNKHQHLPRVVAWIWKTQSPGTLPWATQVFLCSCDVFPARISSLLFLLNPNYHDRVSLAKLRIKPTHKTTTNKQHRHQQQQQQQHKNLFSFTDGVCRFC